MENILTKINLVSSEIIIEPSPDCLNRSLIIAGRGIYEISNEAKAILLYVLENKVSGLESLSDLNRKSVIDLINRLYEKIYKQDSTNSFTFSFTLFSRDIVNYVGKILSPLISIASALFFTLLYFIVFFITSFLIDINIKLLQYSDFFLIIIIYYSSVLIHEIGHGTACVASGQKAGKIGAGLYIIFPVLFCDVTNAWRTNRKQKLLIDTAGLYFQSVFGLLVLSIGYLTGSQIMIMSCSVITYNMLYTLNPILKFDGYWILSDTFNIKNLHQKVIADIRERVILRSLRFNNISSLSLLLFCLLTISFYIYIGISIFTIFLKLYRTVAESTASWYDYLLFVAAIVVIILFLTYLIKKIYKIYHMVSI